MILIDTSGLLSALDASQRFHHQCGHALTDATPPLLLSPFVLAEIDYLLMRNIGWQAQTVMLAEVARGVYRLEHFDSEDIALANSILERYKDLNIGLADASIVVLAERHDVSHVLTLDERHFRALRFGSRKKFKILPFDR